MFPKVHIEQIVRLVARNKERRKWNEMEWNEGKIFFSLQRKKKQNLIYTF